jgi:hypothetical protein
MKEAMLLRAYSPNVFLKGVNAAWAGETIDDCPFTFPAERDEWRAEFEDMKPGYRLSGLRQQTSVLPYSRSGDA